MLVEYLPGESLLHRLDVRTKLFGLFTIVVLSFMFRDPLYNLMLLIFILLVTFQSKISYKRILGFIYPLIPICIFLTLISSFTYPTERFQSEISRVIIFSLLPDGLISITIGGILTGINFSCRIFIMVIASSVLTLTTPIDDFIQLLNRLKVPSHITFMITTALSFIPTLDKKRQHILEAQKARGAKINDKGIFGSIRAYVPIMVPLFVNSILIADNLAKGMLNRGYGYSSSVTPVSELRLMSRDYVLMGVFLVLLISGLYLRIGLGMGLL